MNTEFVFQPERRLGFIVQLIAILLLVGAAGFGLVQASQANLGPTLLLYLLPTLLAIGLVPLLSYQVYALRTAFYRLERDGIQLRWGLRVEHIPMNAVLWVRPASELEGALPLPLFRWPGAVVGKRRLPTVGEVEFLADTSRRLVLIGTSLGVYAVSPAQPDEFLRAFHRLMELGSLSPIAHRSVYPTFLLARVWATRPARVLVVSGLLLSLALLAWVSLAIPGRATIALGFQPTGAPRDMVPSVRLLLLPVLNTLFFLVNLFIGLFLFRKESSQGLAYIVWGGGAFTPLLFLAAVFFILGIR